MAAALWGYVDAFRAGIARINTGIEHILPTVVAHDACCIWMLYMYHIASDNFTYIVSID